MAENLTIGRTAKKAGVNIQTVRYYERRGLLLPESRGRAGYRYYTEEAVKKLRFIKNAQGLGFSLDEIARLLRLRIRHKAQCGPVRRQAEARLKSVREKLAGLRAIEKVLERLIAACLNSRTADGCLILESLEDGGELR